MKKRCQNVTLETDLHFQAGGIEQLQMKCLPNRKVRQADS